MQFNLTRFSNLLKRDFYTYKKGGLYALLSTIGFVSLVYIFARLTNGGGEVESHFWGEVYLAFLFILGLTFTSIVFRDFKTPGGRLQFLSLPASNFEKVASRWFYSLMLFPFVITAVIWIFSMATNPGDGLFAPYEIEELGWIFLGFILLHSSMFLYAVWFNNYVALKAGIVGLLVTIVFGLIMLGLFWLFFHDFFDGPFRVGPREDVNMTAQGQEFFMNKIEPLGEFLIKYILAPFVWIVSYFKMKEKEA